MFLGQKREWDERKCSIGVSHKDDDETFRQAQGDKCGAQKPCHRRRVLSTITEHEVRREVEVSSLASHKDILFYLETCCIFMSLAKAS